MGRFFSFRHIPQMSVKWWRLTLDGASPMSASQMITLAITPYFIILNRFPSTIWRTNMLHLTHNKPHHPPWNKGKLTGQKPPLKLNEVWAIRIRLQIAIKHVTSLSSILLSIANYVAAIWLNSKLAMLRMEHIWQNAAWLCK